MGFKIVRKWADNDDGRFSTALFDLYLTRALTTKSELSKGFEETSTAPSLSALLACVLFADLEE
jgi:hypothetical protein